MNTKKHAVILLSLVLVFALALTGCTSNTPSSSDADTNQVENSNKKSEFKAQITFNG